MSVHYLLPDAVIRYIQQNRLYVDDRKENAARPATPDTDSTPKQPVAPAA